MFFNTAECKLPNRGITAAHPQKIPFEKMIQSIAGQYKVGLSDVNSSLGQETCSQFRGEFGDDQVTFIACDVTSLTSVYILWKETTEFFKTNSIDLWVNNAGVMGEKEGWNKCIDINLFGVLNGITTVMANTPAEADQVTIRKSYVKKRPV